MAATCLCSGRDVASAVSLHRDQLAVSLREDGLVIYDARNQKVAKSWTLGLPGHQIRGAPAFDSQTQTFYVATRSASNGSSSHDVLLSWPKKSEAGSLKQIAGQAELPASIHSLHPLPTSGSSHAMEIDAHASLLALYTNGTVAACSPTEGVLSENIELCGNAPLAAALLGEGLAVVHLTQRTGGASSSTFHVQAPLSEPEFVVQNDKVHCGPVTHLAPPPSSTVCRAVAAVPTPSGAAVFWSDGTLAVYRCSPGSSAASSNSQEPLQPHMCRRLRGFEIPQQQQQSAAPQNGKTGVRSSKKRGLGSVSSGNGGSSSSGSCISLAALPRGLIAIAGWSAIATGGPAVRLVVLDLLYGCIQTTQELSAGNVAGAILDPAAPVQAVPVGSQGEQVAVVAGSSVLLVDLQLQEPTLANLLGALCMDRAVPSGAGQQAPATAAAAGTPLDATEAQETLPGTSRFAAAAAASLHETELDLLVGPGAGLPSAPAPVEYSLEVAQAPEGPSPSGTTAQLLAPATVRWREPTGTAMQQAERSAWTVLLESAARGPKKGKAVGEAASKLVQASQQQGLAISLRLLTRILQGAAETQQWACVGEILAAQHPGSLAACPGLALCLAEAHQYPLLHQLLSQATEVPTDGMAEVLKCLLRSSTSSEAQQAQRAYYEGARAAAESAVAAVEEASRGGAVSEALLAVAACCAGAVEGLTPAQVCLHPLLSVRHDSGVLLGALRQLSAAEALALLRYLHTLLSNYAHLVGDHYLAVSSIGLPAAIVLPHPQALLDWAGAALDANMARLVLRREAAQVLADIRKLVEGQLRTLQRLSQVKGVMQHVQCGASLPSPHPTSASKYTWSGWTCEYSSVCFCSV